MASVFVGQVGPRNLHVMLPGEKILRQWFVDTPLETVMMPMKIKITLGIPLKTKHSFLI